MLPQACTHVSTCLHPCFHVLLHDYFYLQAGRLLEPLELPDPSMAPLPRPGGGRYLRVPSRPSDLERRSGCGPNSTACAVLALH